MHYRINVFFSTLLAFTICCVSARAQTPQYTHQGTTASNPNSFPFTNGFNKLQWLYQGNMFASAPSGSITKIYFKTLSAVTATMNDLVIRIAPTTLGALSTTNFETQGFDTVLSAATYAMTTQAGQWVGIPLQTPYPYTAGQSFIIEITKSSGTGLPILAYQTSESYVARLHANSATATAPTGNAQTLGELGFDIISSSTAVITGPDTICLGSNQNFYGSPTGGSWSINNTSVASISSSGTLTGLTSGSAIITYNYGTGIIAKNVFVKANQSATITLAANPGDTVCGGNSIMLNATVTNAGDTPSYTWIVNGNPLIIPNNNPTYNVSNLSGGTGYNVACVVTSSLQCIANDTASRSIYFRPVVTPSVSIMSNNSTPVCVGIPVLFTATPSNGGTVPIYQWFKNNINIVNANNVTYSDATLQPTDIITCQMTSNATCPNPNIVTSNILIAPVNPIATTHVQISATDTSVCSGESVTVAAIPTNGGSAPTFQWYLNGTTVNNTSGIYNYTPSNNDQVFCVMTSNALCTSNAVDSSDTLTFAVYNLPVVTILQNGNTFSSSAATGNQWYCNGSAVTGGSGQTIAATVDGYYKVVVTDANGCQVTSDSILYQNNVGVSNVLYGKVTKIYPNPAHQKLMIGIDPEIIDKLTVELSITNQLGQMVYVCSPKSSSITIDLEQFSTGIYFVKISTQEGSSVSRFVKE
ncbi:T9SS type A sorting domain-containing protein [Taibaiella soli]|uniref:Secretion system C-terminal sorting domain-containing protein n=1 Tax=Taibaiella soli TaxID=1649169 RepID=A0A2W2BB24_9BACT|nr:T9SS type A sorting domain-containing protein [Taibaiella soli]PZF70836.1 hypothetical protein DN068_21580 [Taibaiella soli]